MTTNANQVLGVLMRQLTGVNHGINHINANFRRMAILAGGAGAAIAGAKGLEAIWRMIDASHKLNDELTRTRQLGGEFAATADQSRATAFKTAEVVPTFAPSDLVKMQRELGSQMQNPQAAMDVLPFAARTAAIVSNYTGEDQETIIKNLVKIIDLRAKLFSMGADGKEHVDPTKLGPELEAAAKGLILGGNYIKSGDLLTLSRQMGVPIKTMTTEGFYAAMMEMAVSQGAARAGTSTTSLFSQLVGGQMPVHTAEEMQRMGLLQQGEWKSDHGHIVLAPEATQRFEGAMKDPIAFITGPLNDLLTKRGMTQDQKLAEVFKLFGRQTTQRLVAEALSAGPQFERARGMFGNIPNVDAQFKMLQSDNLDFNIKGLSEAWQGLMESLGSAGVPLAITILHGLTDGIHELTTETERHPTLAADALALAGGLSALVAVGGGLTVVTIALQGLAPALALLTAVTGLSATATGLTAIAGGLTALAAPVAGLAMLLWALHPTKTQSQEEENKQLGGSLSKRFPGLVLPDQGAKPDPAVEALKKLRNLLGFGPPGSGPGPDLNQSAPGHVEPQSYVAPAPASQPRVMAVTYLQLDGRTIARAVSEEQGRSMSLPPTGATRFDERISPSWPSDSVVT